MVYRMARKSRSLWSIMIENRSEIILRLDSKNILLSLPGRCKWLLITFAGKNKKKKKNSIPKAVF